MVGCVPQPHTCGTPVYLTLFFSLLRRCRLTAQAVGKIKQGHSSAFPPSAEECMLPFASSSRTSRKLRTCLGSPLLAQLGPHLGLASGPFFSGTQPFLPDLLPSEFRASGRLLFSTQLSLSPFRLLPTQSHHTTGNLPFSSLTMDTPRCLPSPGHSSSAVGASTPFCMLCLQCFFCVPHAHHLHAILFHPLSPVTC